MAGTKEGRLERRVGGTGSRAEEARGGGAEGRRMERYNREQAEGRETALAGTKEGRLERRVGGTGSRG